MKRFSWIRVAIGFLTISVLDLCLQHAWISPFTAVFLAYGIAAGVYAESIGGIAE
jgi:hypothetical protein